MLPGMGLRVSDWAWRALEAAKEEVSIAYGSVLEDLQDLRANTYPPSPTEPSSEAEDDEGLRVDDLSAPAPVRSTCEREWEVSSEASSAPRPADLPPARPRRASRPHQQRRSARRCDGFELVDFEEEANISTY